MTIADDNGRQVRRLEVDKQPGLRRVAWNLRSDPPPPAFESTAGHEDWRRRLRGAAVHLKVRSLRPDAIERLSETRR